MTDQPTDQPSGAQPTQAGGRRRRRRRATSAQGAPPPAPPQTPAPVPQPAARPTAAAPETARSEPPRRRGQSARDSGERGLRDLVGAGHSQLGVDGALRGRDVNRPTEDDLARAEREVQIVRRHWTPPPTR